MRPKPIQLPNQDALEKASSRLQAIIASVRQERAPYLRQVEANRQLLKANQPRQNAPWKGACELHLPLIKYYRAGLVSRLVRAICSASPLYNVEPMFTDEKARINSSLVERFLDLEVGLMRLPGQIKRIIHAATDDGVAGAYVDWRHLERDRVTWRQAETPLLDENDEPLVGFDGTPATVLRWQTEKRPQIVYEGPQVRYIPVERIGTYPAQADDIQNCTGAFVLVSVTGDDLLLGARAGVFDAEQVERMREIGADAEAAGAAEDATRLVRSAPPASDSFHERPFLLAEGYFLWAVNDKAPAQDWLFTIHPATGTILRAIPNPWGHGMRPIIPIRLWPDRIGMCGDSIADLTGDLQAGMTALLRQVIDGTAKRINPELAVDATLSVSQREEIRKARGPGGLIPLDPAFREALWSLERTPFNPVAALNLIEVLRQFTERATGISDQRLGRSSPRTLTATEVQELLAEGEQLIAMVVDEVSGGVSTGGGLSEVGDLIRWLCYEFVDRESVQTLWRVASNDETPGLVGVEELGGNYRITAAGTTEASNRALQAQKAEKVLAMTMADPLARPEHLYAARMNLLNAMGVREPEKYVGSEYDFMARHQQAQQEMATMGGMPIPQQAEKASQAMQGAVRG